MVREHDGRPISLEQIAVKASYLNLLPSGAGLPNFEGVFYINSDGTIFLNHDELRIDGLPFSFWKFTQTIDGKNWLTFFMGGESFDITNEEYLQIAIPFFQKHFSNKFQA